MAADRGELAALLVARGFAPEDARGFAARLTEAQATEDLRWHRWEARWYAHGAPVTWPPEVKAAVTEHYLDAPHHLDAVDLMAMYGRVAPDRALAPSTPSGTGVAVVGTLLILAAAGVAWAAARR